MILTTEPSVQALNFSFRISPILVNIHTALYSHWWRICFVSFPLPQSGLELKAGKERTVNIVKLTQDSQKAISTVSVSHILTGQVNL